MQKLAVENHHLETPTSDFKYGRKVIDPPHYSSFTLPFGKHRGKKLQEVPGTYIVKYLIPHYAKPEEYRGIGQPLADALRTFMNDFPEVKSQAGRQKTVEIGGDVMKRGPLEKRRRTRKDRLRGMPEKEGLTLQETMRYMVENRGKPRW